MPKTLNQRVDAILDRSGGDDRKSSDERMTHIVHVLCMTYGWDYHTFIKQPISFIWALVDGLREDAKRRESEHKKQKEGFKKQKKGF